MKKCGKSPFGYAVLVDRAKHMGALNKGRKFSSEHKEKLSLRKRGLPPPPHKKGCLCFRCSGISPMKGRNEPRPNWKRWKRPDMEKENNHNWKGGISSDREKLRHSIEVRRWAKSVFIRDNFSCCLCHEAGGKLHAHHVKKFSEYPALRTVVDNGVTLCEECHRFIHAKDSHFKEIKLGLT
jgi:hypothetical protein